MKAQIILVIFAIICYYARQITLNQGENGFNSNTTANDILDAYKDVNMKDKVVFITGANTGIGLEAAKCLAKIGATIIVGARSNAKATKAINEIKNVNKNIKLFPFVSDLSSFKSVRDGFKNFKKLNIKIDVLILNAGVMALPNRTETVDGLETQMQVNHFSHYLLTRLLINDKLLNKPSRILSLASHGSTFTPSLDFLSDPKLELKPYNAVQIYGTTKWANILFAKHLDRLYSKDGIISVSLHPGAIVDTELKKHMPFLSVIEFIGPLFTKFFGKTIEQGTATTIYTALAPEVEKMGGKYFSDAHIEKYPKFVDAIEDVKVGDKFWKDSERIVGLKQ